MFELVNVLFCVVFEYFPIAESDGEFPGIFL